MPNHITTVCTVKGDEKSVREFIANHIRPAPDGKGEVFDFESVVPMPQCVKDTIRDWSGPPVGDADVEYYARALLETPSCFITERMPWFPEGVRQWRDLIRWYDETKPAVRKHALASLKCAAETGSPGWYAWSCANWGTKWDAYRFARLSEEPGYFVFRFETAWSVPRPILAKLAEMHPELTLDTESIDEGGGPHFVGHYHGAERRLDEVPEDAERYRRVYGRDPYEDDE